MVPGKGETGNRTRGGEQAADGTKEMTGNMRDIFIFHNAHKYSQTQEIVILC